MGKDYYAILGVGRDADDEQIKRGYRKQAVKWHPDKWTSKSESERAAAEERFKDAAAAYEVLSDKQKRTIYDQYGEEGLKAGGGGGGCGGGGMPGGFGGMGGRPMDGGVKFTFSSGGGGRSMDNARAEGLFRQFFSQGDPFRSADDPFDDIFAGLSGLRRSTGIASGGRRAPRADVLPHGTPVRLCDLSQANFNGASGTIDHWDEARGRYVVSLAEGGSLAVRSQNVSQVVAGARGWNLAAAAQW